jgi:hypothetical protein
MIDLHLHTTASDGRSTPQEVVALAARAGLTTIAVTDHDTAAALSETARLAAAAGLVFVPGIEITAMWRDTDVHVLGYYLDDRSPALAAFLATQREDRLRRVRAMAERLAALGMPVRLDDVLSVTKAAPDAAVGRPRLARALVEAGHVADMREAFDRWLGEGKPAHVPRRAPSPSDVVASIQQAGGLASLAHPGLLGDDSLIPELVAAGLDALEVHHPDHPPALTAHYAALAHEHGLAITGGSDYHGESAHGAPVLGSVTLPAEDFARLEARARDRRRR